MNPDLTAYREQLTAIRDDIYDAIGGDDEAYAALRQGGDLHPYTALAEQIWRKARGPDLWRQHDLAILLHARAYDLEAADDPDAERYWREALAQWGAIVAADGFWDRLAAHMDLATGQPVDRATVAAVRARLPIDLLDVHVTLIQRYRTTDLRRARSHVRLLKQAPFDPGVIARLRHDLVADTVAGAHQAVQAGRYEDIIERLQAWLAVDEDNPELIRWLLYATREWNQRLVHEGNWGLIGRNLATATDGSRPLLGSATADGSPLAAELARMQYWRGLMGVREVSDALQGGATPPSARRNLEKTAANAVGAFDRAVELDPNLLVDAWYSGLSQRTGEAHFLCGMCELMEASNWKGFSRTRHCREAARHLRSSAAVNRDVPGVWLYLCDALLMPDDVPKDNLDEAAEALTTAESLTRASAPDPQLREHLDQVRKLLAFELIRAGDPRAAELLSQRKS